jgi:hypothetical protein
MISASIYDIEENKIKIENKPWDDPEIRQLAVKSLFVIKQMVDYHKPFLDRGQELFDKYDGDILDEYQRSVYEDIEHKYTIEPPIMKSPIRSLLGHIIKGRKSGEIIVEEGDYDDPNDSINEIQTMNITLKDFETKTKEQLKIRDAIHDSLVACYPNFLVWEKCKPLYDYPLKFKLVKLPWNSCVYGPINVNEPDLSDIKELVYFDLRSKADLMAEFPKMKAQIESFWKNEHVDENMISAAMNWNTDANADDIEKLRSIINAANHDMRVHGLVTVYKRMYPVETTAEVFIKISDADGETHVILPENWSDERKEKWAEDHKNEYEGPFETDTTVLWTTILTEGGLVLSNKMHWYQEGGKIPGTAFVPCMLNGKPSGPAVDMSAEVLRNCIAQIEYLDDMRKGNGLLAMIRAGAVDNIENLPEEACKSFGVGVISKDFPGSVQDAFATIQRSASAAWRDYAEFTKQQMYDNTRLNETMQGEFAPRQAAIAKENEIAQALITNALYMDNFNYQWENFQNVKLSMVPRAYDETMMIVEGYDENEHVMKRATLNIPQYNMAGEKENVLNDVTSRKYKWKVSAVDDSPTAKSRMMQEAGFVLNASSGPLLSADPSGKLLAVFLSALDNPILNKAGKAMFKDAEEKQKAAAQSEQAAAQAENQINAAKAQADLERAKKQGISFNFTGEQLAQYPGLLQIAAQIQQAFGNIQTQTQAPQSVPEQPAPEMVPA